MLLLFRVAPEASATGTGRSLLRGGYLKTATVEAARLKDGGYSQENAILNAPREGLALSKGDRFLRLEPSARETWLRRPRPR
ncbi:MAG: hypothetical protein AB7N76_31595 [Planctomycetota bacterium]